VLAAALVLLGPHGTDWAQHAYQLSVFERHGLTLWNNEWYAGRSSFITYSTLYYPLAALVGIGPLAVLSVGAATLAFGVVARRRWGAAARPAIAAMAVVLALWTLTASFPFLLGVAFALGAIVAVQRRRFALAALALLATVASSPLAFALAALWLAAAGWDRRGDRRAVVAGGAVLIGVGGLMLVVFALFPSQARNPFPLQALLPTLAFSAILAALARGVREARVLLAGAVLLGAASLVLFAVPTELGEGISRVRFVALPLALLAWGLRGWRPRALGLAAVTLAATWNVLPAVSAFLNGLSDRSEAASFWRPAIAFVDGRLGPGERVEVVDTERHWAAYYFPAAGIPLVRGWFRQDDFPRNRLLYEEGLTAERYGAWLRSQGARYVVLPDAELDYSAQAEARLLRSGRSGLRSVLRTDDLEVFEVPGAPSLVSGPGNPEVVAMGIDSVDLRLDAAGIQRVAITYSPHWATDRGCLRAAADGVLLLDAPGPGPVRLTFDVDPARFADILLGRATVRCG